MPANSIVSYFHDSRNNFDAVRSIPLCAKIDQQVKQCQNIHISMNCYYGYHGPKTTENVQNNADCEMLEAPHVDTKHACSRKRSSDDIDSPQIKRIRQEVQREKNNEPETKESTKVNTNTDYLLETLYWNIHGGNFYNLVI